jgi:tetratricopeptide (TPR) repeat protein
LRRRLFLFFSCTLFFPAAFADTIYFKNGIYIEAENASEKDGQIEYWVGSTKYTIPSNRVEKITKGAAPAVQPAPRGTRAPSSSVSTSSHYPGLTTVEGSSPRGFSPVSPSFRPKVSSPAPSLPSGDSYWSALRERIVNRDRIDESALSAIENQAKPIQTANAYFVAGIVEMEHRNPEAASRYFERALTFSPDSTAFLAWYADSLLEARHYSEAAVQAERWARMEPQSAQAFRSLAAAQYNSDHTREAVRAWERAQELEPSPDTQRLLERTRRELATEERSNQQESRHFSLRYVGGETSLALQRDLLGTLEEQYQQLAHDLDYSPDGNLVVTLYTQKQFFDITEAPSWAGGLNDGKLRIPIQGISTVTPELQRVLKHELTHSFIGLIAGDSCPSWLNEGMAQLMEPRDVALCWCPQCAVSAAQANSCARA